MQIDISSIGTESTINICKEVIIPSSYLENSEICNLKNVVFNGILKYEHNFLTLVGSVSGVMTVLDSISLDEIDYDFNAEIDEEIEENLEKSSNILDITDVLWQNILLEVPLKLTNVENFDEYHGDGWKLVSEDSIENTNNPFKELKDMLGEE